jgi:PhnB protein
MQIHEMYPYFRMKDTEAAIRFYKAAFGVTEKFRLVEPSGRIGHVELAFGPNTLMLSDEFPEYGITAPEPAEVKICIHIHVEDADALMAQAIKAGATLVRPAADHFYGERSGAVKDPFGYDWLIGHSIEAVEPAEMQRRYTEMLKTA